MRSEDAFELFTAESILKRHGLTFDEIEAGIVDGKDDGGIDSVYIFVNNAIIAPDSDLDSFKRPVEIDLYIIQSKMDAGFSETAMAHLSASIPELTALGANDAKLAKRYNNEVRGWFQVYRETLKALAAQFPTIRVHVVYCTLANAPNAKVEAMIPSLEQAVAAHHPKADCKVELWNAAKLNGSRPVHESRLKSLKVSGLKQSDIKIEFDHAMKLFDKAGAEDKTAKDITFTKTLKSKSLTKRSSLSSGSKPKTKTAAKGKKK